ncbi:alpha/beta fold hydrolase [Micromonospora costi]|uniref:alpha/beta fold hydrolase n=1 Tax=Micromonospora costi TaxID=1530042 RepID=UPI0033C5B624
MRTGRRQRRIPGFTSEQARQRFLDTYDIAMRAWPEPRHELDVDTEYGRTHVHRHGSAPGRPIVLLHGASGNSSNWYPQVAALGGGHTVYALDTIDDPGRSVPQRPLDNPVTRAEWLDQVLAGLRLDAVHLVGVSYGGWMALNQAVHRPARLASVTLLDPGGLQRVPVKFYANVLAGALAMLAPRRTRPLAARLLANQALLESDEQLAPVLQAARSWRTDRPAAPRLEDDELRRVAVPVQLLIAGRSSLLHPARALARARTLIPGVRAEIVPGAGHGLSLERPDLVNRRILDFVAAVDAADAGSMV